VRERRGGGGLSVIFMCVLYLHCPLVYVCMDVCLYICVCMCVCVCVCVPAGNFGDRHFGTENENA